MTLRLHPLAHIESYLWVLAFLIGFQFAAIVRMSAQLQRADDAIGDVIGSADAMAAAATSAVEEVRQFVVDADGEAATEPLL